MNITLKYLDSIVSSFIKKSRGDLSRTEFSKVLGHSNNVVQRWESGVKQLLFDDFVLICKHTNIDLKEIIFSITGIRFDHDIDGATVCSDLLQTPSSRTLAESTLSSQKIKRLSAGKSKLTFEDFLTILNCNGDRVVDFLAYLFDDDELKEIFTDASFIYNELIAGNADYSTLYMLLSLNGYKSLKEHSSTYLGELMGITAREINEMLKLLERAKMIRWEKKHFICAEDTVENRAGRDTSGKKAMIQWRSKINESNRAETVEVPSKHRGAYLVYGTNAEIDAKVYELTSEYYMGLKALLTECDSRDFTSIKVMSVDLFCPLTNHHVLDS